MIEYELNIIKTGHRAITPGGLLAKFALSYTFARSREREFEQINCFEDIIHSKGIM